MFLLPLMCIRLFLRYALLLLGGWMLYLAPHYSGHARGVLLLYGSLFVLLHVLLLYWRHRRRQARKVVSE